MNKHTRAALGLTVYLLALETVTLVWAYLA